jgi:ribosomal protein S17E
MDNIINNNMLRESKIIEQMELLGIQDVTTDRQHKNGTVVWRLPIKINYPHNKDRFIEVASFKTGYVRNQNCGYSNYQLNKRCEGEPEYFKLANGDYRKFTTRGCVLIPKEIDRLEYLIKYCVKNYYIKNANQVPNGEFYPKWMYDSHKDEYKNRASEVNDLQNKLNTIKRIADYE